MPSQLVRDRELFVKAKIRIEHGYFLPLILIAACLFTACAGNQVTVEPTIAPITISTQSNLPKIASVGLDRTELPKYESLELIVGVSAEYKNPYDARQIALDSIFTGPDGKTMTVPGFWDGEGAWKIRFTPSQAGAWKYSITVQDTHGQSLPNVGEFSVSPSSLHG